MSLSARDKHVLITGGSSGIGLALAKACLARGAKVSIVDIAINNSELSSQLQESGSKAKIRFLRADVGLYDQVERAFTQAEHTLGPIDILVPCAGIASNGMLLWEEDLATFERINCINYLGVVNTLRAALPGMVSRARGHVLIVSSLMASLGSFAGSSYAGPKAAVRALADSLRLELIGTGVGISLMLPGFVDTPMVRKGLTNPKSPSLAKELVEEMLPRAHRPEQVAELALHAVEKGHYLVKAPDGMSNMIITAGANLAPRLFPLIVELLLAPVYILLFCLGARGLERRILRWRQAEKTKQQ